MPDKIDKEYVDRLTRPLVRFMSEPPHDALTVLAIATQAALHEALEMIELGEIGLKRAADGAYDTRADSLPFEMDCYGRIYAGTKVIRRVAEVLELMRTPGMRGGQFLGPPPRGQFVGRRITAARALVGMGRGELADLLHIDRSHLSRIERDERSLTDEMAERIAGILGVSVRHLLTGDGT